MNSLALTVCNGFCFGIGLIVAAIVMKILFHSGFCG